MEIGHFFFGNALSVIDGKSRASLPAGFRAVLDRRAQRAYVPGEAFPDKAVLLGEHPQHPCLQGYDRSFHAVTFARLQAKVAGMADADPIAALDDAQLESFGTAMEVGYDPSGRMVLPAQLRTVAGIELNGLAFFVAAGETFQIWNPDRFRAAHHDKPRLMRVIDALLDERRAK